MDFASYTYGEEAADQKSLHRTQTYVENEPFPYSTYTTTYFDPNSSQNHFGPIQRQNHHNAATQGLHTAASSPHLLNSTLPLHNEQHGQVVKTAVSTHYSESNLGVGVGVGGNIGDQFNYGYGAQTKAENGTESEGFQRLNFISTGTNFYNSNPANPEMPGNFSASSELENGFEMSQMSPRTKKRKGTKRRTKNPNVGSENSILWEDLNIDDKVASIVFSVLPKEKVNQFLNDGASSVMCTLSNHLTSEQQNAIKIVKQRLRAEKKSRREKQRRVHVNNSLMALANTINVKPEEQDMNSILIHAVEFIAQQKQEIEKLRELVDRKASGAE